MASKVKTEASGKLVATENLDITVSHPDGYDVAFTFQEGEEVPEDLARRAGLVKDKPSKSSSKDAEGASDAAKDAAKGYPARTAEKPGPRKRTRGKK